MKRDPLNVVALAYDGLCTFEFSIAAELLGLTRPEFDEWYQFRVARVDHGPMRAKGGLTVNAPHGLRILSQAGTIVIAGWKGIDVVAPERLLRALRRAHSEGARLVAICSGSHVLAQAGLLDGLRATTHWLYADHLAANFPNIDVDPDVLYVDEGQVLTSAGSAAGIDVCLHLITRDFGAAAANIVARRVVVPPHRDGGQKQFVSTPISPDPVEQSIARMQDSVRARLTDRHDVESMARLAKMSQRTFARRFKATSGTTPHRWLQAERVQLAKSLLETSGMSLDEIADRTGFADAQLLRLHFKRSVGTPPSAYRRAFAS